MEKQNRKAPGFPPNASLDFRERSTEELIRQFETAQNESDDDALSQLVVELRGRGAARRIHRCKECGAKHDGPPLRCNHCRTLLVVVGLPFDGSPSAELHACPCCESIRRDEGRTFFRRRKYVRCLDCGAVTGEGDPPEVLFAFILGGLMILTGIPLEAVFGAPSFTRYVCGFMGLTCIIWAWVQMLRADR